MRHRIRFSAAALLVPALLAGCAALHDRLSPQPPTAGVTGVRVTALGFNHAELALDVRVDNPNAVAIDLAGFDYRVRAAGHDVLRGEQRRRLELPARDTTPVEIPLRLDFGEIAGILGGLSQRDSIDYDVRLGLDVDVPVLGQRHIVVTTGGKLPIPHRPQLSLQSLRLQRLTTGGAVLALTLGIANPNGFALTLDRFDWGFEVDGNRWAHGGSSAPLRIAANGRGALTLSLEIDFGTLGRDGYALLAGGGPIDYALRATLEATAGDGRLGHFEMPWSSSGRIDLR